jgi:hypothetical protein
MFPVIRGVSSPDGQSGKMVRYNINLGKLSCSDEQAKKQTDPANSLLSGEQYLPEKGG